MTDIIIRKAILTLTLPFILFLFFACDVFADNVQDVPVKGMVTMIDLGAKQCIPCKMMAPILEKLKKTYKGTAAIIFIDVRKNYEPATRFGIRVIPTQIFFDKQGKEVFRHEGFLNEDAIVEQLKKMGVNQTQNKKKQYLRVMLGMTLWATTFLSSSTNGFQAGRPWPLWAAFYGYDQRGIEPLSYGLHSVGRGLCRGAG